MKSKIFRFLFLVIIIALIGCSKEEKSTGPSVQYTQISGSLTGTLGLSGSPYAIVGDSYVPSGSSLNIDPGVEIAFDGFYTLTIEGILYAIGTPENFITFTSTVTNQVNERGNWEGLVFTNNSLNSVLEYCRIEDGASYVNGLEANRGAVNCRHSSPVIRKCLLVYNGYNAVYADTNSSPLIDGCTITGNAFSGLVCNNSAEPLIQNSIVVTNDDYGIFSVLNSNSAPRIEYCDIWDNFTTDIFGIDTTGFPGNTSINPQFANADSGDFHLLSHSPCIDLGDPQAIVDFDGTRRDLGVFYYDQSNPSEIRNALKDTLVIDYSPYFVTSSIWVEEGDTLVIDPGVVLEFNAETTLRFSFYIYGTLIAEGTEGNEIVFTSSKAAPAKGDWDTLYFHIGTDPSSLSYCRIDYASVIFIESNINIQNCVFDNIEYDVLVQNCNPDIDYSVFSNMGYAGLFCQQNASPLIKHSVFTGNQGYGIFCTLSSNPTIVNNLIYGNATGGIRSSIFSQPQIVNNTIVENGYYGIWATGNSNPILKNNIFASNGEGGVVCVYSSVPDMSYNNSFGHVSDNENTDYSNTPPNVGIWTATNANGDSCDMYFNISLDPLFLSDSVYTLSSSSHCIDAGDPTISDWDGSVSDMGAFGGPEGNWIVPAINPNSPDLPLTFYKVMK